MGYKTKVDWCDSTWSPVTGCLHGCEYCYARKIAERFGIKPFGYVEPCVLDEPIIIADKKEPYPVGFSPTFHRYRLEEPQKWKKPRNIFVCSMADLFGEWVPDEWIKEVFAACEKAPQHRYLFLTKNPKRYDTFLEKRIRVPDNAWLGFSIDYEKDEQWFFKNEYIEGSYTFISVEPIMHRLNRCELAALVTTDWVIIGAETGNRKDKVTPKREWVMQIADKCAQYGIPVFMKESLRELMGDEFQQKYPWPDKEDV